MVWETYWHSQLRLETLCGMVRRETLPPVQGGSEQKEWRVSQEPTVAVYREYTSPLKYLVFFWHLSSPSFPGEPQANILLAHHLLSPHLILYLSWLLIRKGRTHNMVGYLQLSGEQNTQGLSSTTASACLTSSLTMLPKTIFLQVGIMCCSWNMSHTCFY